MSSRDEIFRRLKSLRTDSKIAQPEISDDAIIYSDFPKGKHFETFCERFESLHGELIEADNPNTAALQLEKLLSEAPPDSCLVQEAPALNEIIACSKILIEKTVRMSEEYYHSKDISSFGAGISLAGYLVARTGSIIVDSQNSGGRLISVLPPAHIVIAHEEQIVPSLEQAFSQLDKVGIDGSSISIISGPSRTSDIEKELVLGAHGPRRLVLILIREGKT